ncbi:hypothetical protein [Pseudomonas sp. PB3P13]
MQTSSNGSSGLTVLTAANQYQGLLADYDLLLSRLRSSEMSAASLATTLVQPSPFSALALPPGEVQANGLVSLAKMAVHYGMAPWNPEDAAEHLAAIQALEEKRARHSLQLDDSIDIDAVNRGPTETEQKTIDDLDAANPDNPTTIEQLVLERVNEQIHEIVSRSLPAGEKSLLAYLGHSVLPLVTIKQLQTTPTVYLEKILKSERAESLADNLLQQLDWYGGKSGEDASPIIRAKLLGRAIRIWTGGKRANALQDVAGYPWQQISNYGKSYQTVWTDFEQHLLDTAQASTKAEAVLLALLWRGGFPSDFCVPDVPANLTYRSSIVWVNYVHGLNLAEVTAPDRTRHMTFQQIVDFPFEQSEATSTPEHLERVALTRIRPTVLWAITNGFLNEREDSQYTRQEIESAVTELENHNQALAEALPKLDIDPPERLKIADRELKKVFGMDFSRGPSLARFDNYARSHDVPAFKGHEYQIYSFKDVYASGKLDKGEQWKLTKINGTTVTSRWISLNSKREIMTGGGSGNPFFERVAGEVLPDIEKVFDTEFNSYVRKLRSGYQKLISTQLATLPLTDRQALEYGELQVYTLRKETTGQEADNETAQMHLPLRARKGFFVQARHKGGIYYYELLPRAGIIRALPSFNQEWLHGARKSESWKVFKNASTRVDVLRHKTLPFDWDAHATGAAPKSGATCQAIIEPLGQPFDAPPAQAGNQTIPQTLSSSRTHGLTVFISNELLFIDESALKLWARGETAFDREQAKLDKATRIFKGFIPFWSSVEDLESGDKTRLIQGAFGLFTDLVSFAVPAGKFASGSIKLASTAGKIGIRATLPSFAKLTTSFLLASLDNLNPLSIVPSLLKLGGYALIKLGKAGLKSFKSLTRTGHYDFTKGMATMAEPGLYRPLSDADALAYVRGVEDVPVRNVSAADKADYRLLDPLSSRPYGPRLADEAAEISLGRSRYSPRAETDSSVIFDLPENARIHRILELDGRTTLLIDEVPYRLDGRTLRRVDSLDASQSLHVQHCRVRRVVEAVCLATYVYGKAHPTPTTGSYDPVEDLCPWFGDRLYTPAPVKPGRPDPVLALDGQIYTGTGDELKLYTGKRSALGLPKKMNPKARIEATVEFQKGIYGRIKVKGVHEGLDDDVRQVGTLIIESKLDSKKEYLFTRLNATDYYFAEIDKGKSVVGTHRLQRILDASLSRDPLFSELYTVYTGSVQANNAAAIYGVEKVKEAIAAMEEIAIPLGGLSRPADNLTSVKVSTTPGQAVLFDHKTRMIVCEYPIDSKSWVRTNEASPALRERTADIFNALFDKPLFQKKDANTVAISKTMNELQRIVKKHKPMDNPRNIAYGEIKHPDGKVEVFVSVSGGGGDTRFLPLFAKQPNAGEVVIGNTTYINIDHNLRFERASLSTTATGQFQALPRTANDLSKYTPELTARPTSLDSESKLIRFIRQKYPDDATRSPVTIATTLPPCDSCAVVLQQFAHTGGKDALKVIFN